MCILVALDDDSAGCVQGGVQARRVNGMDYSWNGAGETLKPERKGGIRLGAPPRGQAMKTTGELRRCDGVVLQVDGPETVTTIADWLRDNGKGE